MRHFSRSKVAGQGAAGSGPVSQLTSTTWRCRKPRVDANAPGVTLETNRQRMNPALSQRR